MVDVKSICEAVQTRQIPDDWKIIMVHAKEREMKEAPRMFAMMVFEMRVYFCVTEMNLSKILLDYFPQQTITLDESELIKRLLFISILINNPSLLLDILVHMTSPIGISVTHAPLLNRSLLYLTNSLALLVSISTHTGFLNNA
jgi:hypothetical protein